MHTLMKYSFTSSARRLRLALAGSLALAPALAAPFAANAQAYKPQPRPAAAAPALLSAPQSQLPDVTPGAYVLAPSDQLQIVVQGHDELTQTVQVLGDGTFHFPIAGKVQASGKTVDQLETALAHGISGIVKDPQVTVLVRESHTRKISVAGAVKAPGLYEYHPGMRLLELIAASGGPLQAPELTQATVITAQGTQSIPVDLPRLLSGGDTTQNLALAPGDLLLLSPRDPATSMIQVIGQVEKPGQYPVMTGGSTLSALLTESGGPTPSAALTQAQLMHAGTVRPLNLHALKYNLGDPAGRIVLVAGDTLLVPENKQKIAVLGEVRAPAVYLIPDGEDLPITQALAQAGGSTVEADKKQVGVLRLGSDNKRHLIAVNMEAMLRGDASVTDSNLKPGDILVVPTRHRKQGIGEYIGQVPGLFYISRLLTGGRGY